MSIKKNNIIEIVLKTDLDLPLTEEEEKCLETIDDDVKELILRLINGDEYRQETIMILTQMMSNLNDLSESDREIIIKKCQDKIDDLLSNKKI